MGLVTITLACLALCFSLRATLEPKYKGKPLHEWADGLTGRVGQKWTSEEEWREAIEHTGEKSVPTLMKWLEREPGLGWRAWSRVEGALPNSFRTTRIFSRLQEKASRALMVREDRAWAAQRALIRLGANARSALPKLMQMLRDRQDGYLVSRILGSLGKEAFPEVLKCLSDPGFSNYVAAVDAIGSMRNLGDASAPAVPILCRLLHSGNPTLTKLCVEGLGNLRTAPEVAVPELMRALTNSLEVDVMLSRKCAEVLGQFGLQAGEAVPGLCVALKSADGITTEEAAIALGRISASNDLAVPALINYLKTGRHRKAAVQGLAGYGSAAYEAIPLVREALSDADHDTRAMAKEALLKLAGTQEVGPGRGL